jgi:transcriptional regulator with XRE-family HTH domain
MRIKMVNCTSCASTSVNTKLVSSYEATGLGAPFKVILEDAVKEQTCSLCGKTLGTYIPDMEGLFHAVVFSRALEPRKLSGAEVRFMRHAMGWKAKDLAKHLGVSAEHLSRCESGVKVMAPATEKLFRLYSVLRTPDKAALEELELAEIFDLIEVQATWDASKPLVFHFVRRPQAAAPVDEDNDKWRKERLKAA